MRQYIRKMTFGTMDFRTLQHVEGYGPETDCRGAEGGRAYYPRIYFSLTSHFLEDVSVALHRHHEARRSRLQVYN